MCSTICQNETCIQNHKCLNLLAGEVYDLEKKLEKAENNFSQALWQSTASINLRRLKCRLCLADEIKPHQRIPPQIELECVSNDTVQTQIHLIQKELEKSITRSGWSIKASLMKLSNLLAQHELLFLPFCELKECYHQLLSRKISEMSMETQMVVPSPKLSYAKALQCVEEISVEIEQTKQRILGLTEEQRSLDSVELDYSNFLTNEYKILSQISNKCENGTNNS